MRTCWQSSDSRIHSLLFSFSYSLVDCEGEHAVDGLSLGGLSAGLLWVLVRKRLLAVDAHSQRIAVQQNFSIVIQGALF